MAALGVRLRDNQLTYPAMRDLVCLAEQRGYDSVWLPESSGREVFTELTALAQASARVRLGTGIVPVFTRLPTVAAAMATAASVAPGRVILGWGLGIAAGWKQATACISTSLCSTFASLSLTGCEFCK